MEKARTGMIAFLRMAKTFFMLVCVLLLLRPPAFGCNVCHSKNPKMVNMHKELGYKDCFNCHGMGKKRTPEEQLMQRENDQRCVRCHKK